MDEALSTISAALTVDQWKTWAFLVIITSALTETAKRVFFLTMAKTKKKQYTYGAAFVFGAVAAVAGYLMVGTQWTPDYYWAMFGVTAGPIANFAHYITLKLIAWKAPDLANTLKGRS